METTMTTWIECASRLAPEGRVVMTRVDDGRGVRNEQSLMRQGRLWFTPDGGMCVYYTPTHWRDMTTDEWQREYDARKK